MKETRAIGYVRLSKDERGSASLAVQKRAIQDECVRRNWILVDTKEDNGVSGALPWQKRAGVTAAIEAIEKGEADVLVCAKLDRLSRGVLDLASILQRATDGHWALSFLDFGLDTSKPVGRMVSSILASVAEFERERIGERTREALAEKRRQGVRLGRPPSTDPKAVAAILAMRHDGLMFREIADGMNGLDFPTPQGARRWTEESVRLAYHAAKAGRLPAAVLESSA